METDCKYLDEEIYINQDMEVKTETFCHCVSNYGMPCLKRQSEECLSYEPKQNN